MGEKSIDLVKKALPEIANIKDKLLREAVIQIWLEVWQESVWDSLYDAPKNPVDAGKDDRLIDHTNSVTLGCIEFAKTIKEVYGILVDMDHLRVISLLHDVSKLLEYDKNGQTDFGRLIQHGVYGAFKAWEKALPSEVIHSIISHTKKSAVIPSTLEGIILHYIDFADSDVLQYRAGKKLFLDGH